MLPKTLPVKERKIRELENGYFLNKGLSDSAFHTKPMQSIFKTCKPRENHPPMQINAFSFSTVVWIAEFYDGNPKISVSCTD